MLAVEADPLQLLYFSCDNAFLSPTLTKADDGTVHAMDRQ